MKYPHCFRFFLVLFCFTTFLSCNNQIQDPSLTILKVSSDHLMTINFKEIKDSTKIKLGEFASDFKVIPLETRTDCLVDFALYLITRDYILCNAGDAGILQFTREGKFIRKLVSYGKGPIEFERLPQWAVDEDKQILILSTFGKAGYFMSFSLTTGSYLKNIPNAVPSYALNMLLTRNGELLCVPYKKPESGQPSYLLYFQTPDGKLTGSIRGPDGNFITTGTTLYQFENDYRFSQMNDDTLYTIRNNNLIPYLAYNYGEPNPIGTDRQGYKRTRVMFETKNFIFMNLFKIVRVERTANGTLSSGAATWFCLDKTQKKVFQMKDIYNDIIGNGIQSQNIQVQPDGTIVLSYQAVDLKEIAEKTLANPNTPSDLRQRMEKINAEVSTDDNPVLIVGRLKTK